MNIFLFYKLEMNAMEHYLEYLAKCRMDGVAVNIPELVPIIKGLGMKAIASAQCEIQTGGLAQWYQKIGISRIIFPETIVYRDIQSVSHTVPGLEYEVLLMRQDCFRGKGMETVPTCGQCALYHLLHSGVTSVKILSNSEDWAMLLSDINLTKQNIEIASQCDSEEEYLRKMILPEYRNIHCGERFSCYYPEIC